MRREEQVRLMGSAGGCAAVRFCDAGLVGGVPPDFPQTFRRPSVSGRETPRNRVKRK